MSAPVVPPDGSTVVAFLAYLWNSDTGADLTVSLKRRASTGAGPVDELASVTTTTSTPGVNAYLTFTIANAAVDNDAYTYFVEMCSWSAASDQRLYVAQVSYSMP